MKLRTKILVSFLAVAIIPVLLLEYISFRKNINRTILDVQQNLTQISAIKESSMERWLYQNKIHIAGLAQRPLVREYTQLMVAAPDNAPVFFNARDKLLQDHLFPNLDEQSGFLDFSIIRASDGFVMVSTNKRVENTFRKSTAFFIEGLKHTFVDDVRYEIALEEAVMHISTPVLGDNGDVIAVLAGHLNFNDISSIMVTGENFSSSMETYLVNKYNHFITDTRFLPGSTLIKSAYTDGIQKCLAGETVFGEFEDYRGVEVFGNYKWLPERNLCLVTEIDRSEAFQLINDLLSYSFLITAFFMLGILFISLIISKTITNPILELENVAKAIGVGNLDVQINNHGKDELGDVTNAFNQMALSLKRSLQESAHTSELLATLQKATQTMQGATTHAQLFAAAGAEIAKLGFETAIFTLNTAKNKLEVTYLSFDSKAISQIEKLVGKSRNTYKIPLTSGGLYHTVIENGTSMLLADFSAITEQSLPSKASKFVGKLLDLIGIHQGIISPLICMNQEYGVLIVSGKNINPSDVSAIATFANQMANALHNLDLYADINQWATELENRVRQRTKELELAQTASLNMMEDLQQENEARKAAQTNLRQEKDKAQQYLDIAGTMFLVLSTSGEITLINRKGNQVLGYQGDELIGRNWFETCLPPDSQADVQQVFQKMMAGEVEPVEYYENPVITKTGERRFIAWHNATLKQGKRILGTLASGEDITERVQAENDLKQSRDKYQSLFTSMLNGFGLHEVICDADGKPVDYRFLEVNPFFEILIGLKTEKIIGRTVKEVLPQTEPYWIELYGKVALTGVPIEFEQYSSELDRYFQVNAYSPKIGQFASIFSDITDRKIADGRIQALLKISRRVTSQPYDQKPLQVALDEIVKSITLADSASIWLLNTEKGIFEAEAWIGLDDETMRAVTIPEGKGIISVACKDKKGIIRNNIPSDPDYILFDGPGFNAIKSIISAPLIYQGTIIGAICVDNLRKTNAFSGADLAMLESIATQLSGIIENTRLFEQVENSREELHFLSKRLVDVHEEERKLVAMDLHDYFGQVLTSLKLSLRPESFVKKSPRQQQELIKEANLLMDEMMDSAEDLSLRLRPTIIDDLGITPAFEWHINRYIKQTGLNVNVDISLEHGKRYAPEVEITLYRVMEESLTNVVRYSDSDEIKVHLYEENACIHLMVQDNGVGFDLDQIENQPGEHTGITGIRERVHLLDGSMDISSEINVGTTIHVSLPIAGLEPAPLRSTL